MSARSLASLLGVAVLLYAGPVRAGPIVVTDDAPARVALLVGVDAFDDDGWPDLRYTRNDAEALGRQLEAGAGFHTRVLVGPEHTTRDAFVGALDDLANAGLRANDTVVVYVSTHGTLSRGLRGDLRQVLVFRDTGHDRPYESGLPLGALIERFEALPSRRKVLILATCYSGAGKSSLSATIRGYLSGSKGAITPPLHDVSSATIILSASTWGEAAREDESLEHDVYTHFLLEALHGYDPNNDGATAMLGTVTGDMAGKLYIGIYNDADGYPPSVQAIESMDLSNQDLSSTTTCVPFAFRPLAPGTYRTIAVLDDNNNNITIAGFLIDTGDLTDLNGTVVQVVDTDVQLTVSLNYAYDP